MAIVYTQYDGTVPDTIGDLVPAVGETNLVFSMMFHNGDTVPVELTVWLRDGASTRQMIKTELESDSTLIVDTKFVLLDTHSIRGAAGTAGVITYWISVAETT